jgi:hypothetical protein
MKSRDDLFMANDEILLSSKPCGILNGTSPASVKGHVGLSLMGVNVLTPPIAAHGRLPTVFAILFALKEKCLPPWFKCVINLLLKVLGLLNDF